MFYGRSPSRTLQEQCPEWPLKNYNYYHCYCYYYHKLLFHPNYKLKLQKQRTLSNISWHLTVKKIDNIDNSLQIKILVYWTLTNMTKFKHEFYLGLALPSTKYTQCQVTFQIDFEIPATLMFKKLRNLQFQLILNIISLVEREKGRFAFLMMALLSLHEKPYFLFPNVLKR